MKRYEQYTLDITNAIKSCIDNMGCQPILFIGTGISKRYFEAPNWEQLLESMAEQCPNIDMEFAYYQQSCENLIEVGERFTEKYKEWAWSSGRDQFDEELFHPNVPPDIYLKTKVSEHLASLTPKDLNGKIPKNLIEELKLLKGISPHSIITTNYDKFLELLFPDFEAVIGQSILKQSFSSIGEILKIHGCISQPNSIVLNKKDYVEFKKKKKYLSAKLLTYFAEHPMIFLGYSAEDPNIKEILTDIDEIISPDGDLIPNIFIVQWEKDIETDKSYPTEKVLNVTEGKEVRINNITANDFRWIFEALSANPEIKKVDPKILRAILARTYDLVRCDVPRKLIEVDFSILKDAAESDMGVAKLFGITTIDHKNALNTVHKYTISEIAKKLGFDYWYGARKIMLEISKTHGVNIQESDNNYHVAIKMGGSVFHKYSDKFFQLLLDYRDGKEVELEL